ncbi:MAG: GntR family transcriptional regulator [Solobacterium sp.]|nr:GntR family transcriptional regulator [Solobacterium sp.]
MAWTFRDGTSIYLQIIERVKADIAAGRYSPGEKFPSIRDFAAETGVNPNTVQRSFAQLEKDGYLTSNRTAGRFVTEEKETLARLRDELKNRYIAEMLKKTEALGYTDEEIVNTIRERKTV